MVAVEKLTGRVARCSCGREEPSDADLFALEFQGAGGESERHCAECGYYEVAHGEVVYGGVLRPHPIAGTHEFRPRAPLSFDTYYCGCRGWD